jgi:hypothetical protein
MNFRTCVFILSKAIALLPLVACSPDAEDGARGPEAAPNRHIPKDPPPPVTAKGPCIISADCPAGTHCDLGECVQDCSTEKSCSAGLQCSVRARCIKPDSEDSDPAPATEHAGTVRLEPTAAELTELDDTLELKLSSNSTELVDYRIDLSAPFLRLTTGERGQFAGSTTLRFAVDPSALSGTVTPGTVLIHTTLGDVIANASIRVGLTGRYQGVMRYLSGSTPLGDVGIAVEMLDKNGDVSVRVDPESSMTFPKLGSSVASGRGIFTFSEGLSVTVAQVYDSAFGGSRNHFKRAVGRRVAFALRAKERGKLEGTFEEQIHGVLGQPIRLTGTAYLEPLPQEQELDEFTVAEPPAMPVAAPTIAPASVFPGWTDGSCFADCGSGDLNCIQRTIEPIYYERLVATLSGEYTSADPFDQIANTCEKELALTSLEAYRALPSPQCALVPPLACGVRELATGNFGTTELWTARGALNRLFARVLSPPLLVAQNHIVQGLKESFTKGLSTQKTRFAKARAILDPPATFVMSSGVLEALRTVPVSVAQGEAPSSDSPDDPTRVDYPSGRALARLLYVLHTLDGEEGRNAAVDLTGTPAAKVQSAQERGVLGFLEAATLAAILESWSNPPGVGNEFVGSLTLADRGFSGLQQGALIFGVPEGQVPMVYNPARAQPTNFEQVLETAKGALDQFEADETLFNAATREFEQNQKSLQDELEGVRRNFEDQIAQICGNAFDPEVIRADADWQACGGDGSGEIAELTLEIQQATLRLQASQSRLAGMRKKYDIDEKRLADTQQVRRDRIRFIDSTGMALQGLIIQEGFINAAQKALEVASNASLFNAGAPIGMSLATALLEAQRTQINVARQQLETSQQMRAVADENKIDLIHGMAELQKQIIDAAQLELEMEQDVLAITQADLRRRNTLDRAKRLLDERKRSLVRVSKSPLTDPTYRILQTRLALQAVESRADAQRWLYRAARALEYEINTPLGTALPRAVLGAYNTAEANRLSRCLSGIFSEYSTEFGVPQEFVTTVSVRRMLGITGPRKDDVNGEDLTEGDLFRRSVLRNENIDPQGNVRITFSTNLQPGNDLWSTNVCDDKVATVQAQIIGDFQGDNEAEIKLGLDGGSVMRRCDSDELISWDIHASRLAVVQAGVNTFGEAKPSTSLFGQSVARASWSIIIPSGDTSPANRDLDFKTIEDVVLKISHKALPRQTQSIPLDVSCLGSVGAGR